MDFFLFTKNTNIINNKSPSAQARVGSPGTSMLSACGPGMPTAFSAVIWDWGLMCSGFQGDATGRVLLVPNGRGSGEAMLIRGLCSSRRQVRNSSFVHIQTLHAGVAGSLEQELSTYCVRSGVRAESKGCPGRCVLGNLKISSRLSLTWSTAPFAGYSIDGLE